MTYSPGAPVGSTGIQKFDVVVIGSGAGGGSITHVLAKAGLKVLVLEAGSNWFMGLDDASNPPVSLFTNDELKQQIRSFIEPLPNVEPRTWRNTPADGDRKQVGDINGLPKTVGGGAVHADLKMPRFIPTDFQLGTLLNGKFSGTSFADWPVDYNVLEPFYAYVEKVVGIQGKAGANPFEGPRSTPFPMPPGVEMYCASVASVGLKALGYTPFPYPTAVNSQPYDGRPACNDCGFCTGYGCSSNAKGAPPVTTLRKALLTGNCLLLPQTRATKLLLNGAGNEVVGVQTIGPDGAQKTYTADRYVLAASPIEDARLLMLSGGGSAIGNSSGQVGRNLMFHRQTQCIGIFEQRIHGHRGRAVTTGFADFRGDPTDLQNHPLGGIVELSGSLGLIGDATYMNQLLAINGSFDGLKWKKLIRQSPFRDHVVSMVMQAEDAPQATNLVDLDPGVKDLDGLPVSRITYKNSDSFEEAASAFYGPKMIDIMGKAGAKWAAVAPKDDPPQSAHIMGTLRFGNDPTTSVCDATGRFHDIGNLYAADGALFPTSSGFNPTMTIMTLAMYVGANIASPGTPLQAIE